MKTLTRIVKAEAVREGDLVIVTHTADGAPTSDPDIRVVQKVTDALVAMNPALQGRELAAFTYSVDDMADGVAYRISDRKDLVAQARSLVFPGRAVSRALDEMLGEDGDHPVSGVCNECDRIAPCTVRYLIEKFSIALLIDRGVIL